jgi:hypothetical protein
MVSYGVGDWTETMLQAGSAFENKAEKKGE